MIKKLLNSVFGTPEPLKIPDSILTAIDEQKKCGIQIKQELRILNNRVATLETQQIISKVKQDSLAKEIWELKRFSRPLNPKIANVLDKIMSDEVVQ